MNMRNCLSTFTKINNKTITLSTLNKHTNTIFIEYKIIQLTPKII